MSLLTGDGFGASSGHGGTALAQVKSAMSTSGELSASHTDLGFTPQIWEQRPNVLRAAQIRFFFYSLCSEKWIGYPIYFSKPYQ
ncbi:hypothetical protein [Deinococcus wulumuqiensis]|uniref:hypothetical protein n=1 Tax=Deinococcus wulumuqiensis TaxID=980427 RepID=UPI0013C2CE09|nr:hypothetical protein [Deinococcus wulumuqiensis]